MKWFITCLLLLSTAGARTEEVTVSVAVSLKDAVTEVAKDYENQTEQHVRLNFGASGELAEQIKAGAPVDLFISAADKQVEDLEALKLVKEGSRRIVANNELALIIPAGTGSSSVKSLDDLPSVTRLAIGDPKTVPAGQYAMEVLDHKGLTAKVATKLIYGTNVRQVLTYVQRGEVDAGIVYVTDAKQAGRDVQVVAMAEEGTHRPIQYPAVVISGGKTELAGRFLNYICGEKGRITLKKYGFGKAAPLPSPATQGAR